MSKPYYLSAPDEWYINKVERALTPDRQDELYALFLKLTNHETPCECHKNGKENLIKDIKQGCSNFFSSHYIKYQTFLMGGLVANVSQVRPRFRSQIADVIELGSKVWGLVELIKSEAEDVFNDLSKEKLDRLFSAAYYPPREFTEYYFLYVESIIQLHESLKNDRRKLSRLRRDLALEKAWRPFVNSFAGLG